MYNDNDIEYFNENINTLSYGVFSNNKKLIKKSAANLIIHFPIEYYNNIVISLFIKTHNVSIFHYFGHIVKDIIYYGFYREMECWLWLYNNDKQALFDAIKLGHSNFGDINNLTDYYYWIIDYDVVIDHKI